MANPVLTGLRVLALYPAGGIAWFPIGEYRVIRVQLGARTGDPGPASVELVQSNDGATPESLEYPQSLSVPGVSREIDCDSIAWLGLRVATPSTDTAAVATATFAGRGSDGTA